MLRPNRGAVSIAIVVAAVFAASVVVRARAVGASELRASDESLKAGDFVAAVVHARRAAAWYLAGASKDLAYAKLRTIAEDARARGDTELSLFAYRAIRRASLGSRSLLAPSEADRQRADAAVVRILSEHAAPAETGKDGRETDERRLWGALLASEGPRPGWAALALGGFVLMVAGGVLVGARGIDEKGRFLLVQARTGAMLLLAGLATWLAGMWLA